MVLEIMDRTEYNYRLYELCLGEVLIALDKSGYSPRDVSKALNMPVNTLHNYIRGVSTDPQVSNYLRIVNFAYAKLGRHHVETHCLKGETDE